MAGKSDGSITIDTKLDNSGFSKGSDELKHAVKSLTDQVNETGSKIQNAFKFDFGQPKQAVNSFSRAIKQVNDEIQSLGELGQRALEGDADALARFRSESGETLSKLEEMKAELEKFGSTEFMTPEYAKAADQYQKAATQVDELAKSLENAEAAFEQLTNDFGSSEEYTALEDRIEVLKMYQKEYDAAMKRGDSGAAARTFMEAGVGKELSRTRSKKLKQKCRSSGINLRIPHRINRLRRKSIRSRRSWNRQKRRPLSIKRKWMPHLQPLKGMHLQSMNGIRPRWKKRLTGSWNTGSLSEREPEQNILHLLNGLRCRNDGRI